MRRTSYQKGSLKLADRRKGKVWEFRWREVQIDGSTRRKNIVIGTLEDFPNKSAAQAAADAIRLEINSQTPQQLVKNISMETLVTTTASTSCRTFSSKESGHQVRGKRTASRTLRK